MKTKFKFSALLLAFMLLLSGCGKAPATEPTQEEKKEDPVAEEIQEFFESYVDTDERPIAVMIDNDDKNARPQAGLDDAYLVYEIVVEGGATRFMALYRDANTEKIGPIRSSRHYFLDYLSEHDAIYVHCGWSDRAGYEITSRGLDKINGILGEDAAPFWREDKFKGDWHSTYTNIEKIKSHSQSKGFEMKSTHKSSVNYSDKYFNLSSENAADEIYLPYSYVYNTGYAYNKETELYEKSINKAPYLMQNGQTVAFKNIIIMFIGDSSLGDGTPRREVITTGSGEGYYITNGAYEKITWSKSDRNSQTVYKKADGSPLLVNPGKTIINIISPDADYTISAAQPSDTE